VEVWHSHCLQPQEDAKIQKQQADGGCGTVAQGG